MIIYHPWQKYNDIHYMRRSRKNHYGPWIMVYLKEDYNHYCELKPGIPDLKSKVVLVPSKTAESAMFVIDLIYIRTL